MNRYPQFFNHGGILAGHGFLARVEMEGRCILEETEPGYYTVFGLNPGAASGQGATREEANRDFLDHIEFVVNSFAAEAADYAAFEDLVREFFFDSNAVSAHEWAAAVEAVRSGRPLAEEFDRTIPAETEPRLSVDVVAGEMRAAKGNVNYTPELNVPRNEMLNAA
jgi:hypothetical protein